MYKYLVLKNDRNQRHKVRIIKQAKKDEMAVQVERSEYKKGIPKILNYHGKRKKEKVNDIKFQLLRESEKLWGKIRNMSNIKANKGKRASHSEKYKVRKIILGRYTVLG